MTFPTLVLSVQHRLSRTEKGVESQVFALRGSEVVRRTKLFLLCARSPDITNHAAEGILHSGFIIGTLERQD
jgi:hypothetical protein